MALVGVQLFIWSLTGFYMVLPNIHYIHGDHIVKQQQPNLSQITSARDFSQILVRYPTAKNINLGWLGQQAVYRFTYFDSTVNANIDIMLNAQNGQVIRPLRLEDLINLIPHIINLPDTTDNPIDTVLLLRTDSPDIPSEVNKARLPLWQVQLNSWDKPRVYIDPKNGEVVSVRNHAWRIFDLFWRLHIMDYFEGENTGNRLILVVSILSFLAILAGSIVLVFRLKQSSEKNTPNINTANILETEVSTQHQMSNDEVATPPPNTPFHWRNSFSTMAKSAHKWLALLVFVQLTIWVVSGFLLGRVDYSLASGKQTKNPLFANEQSFNIRQQKLYSLKNILKPEHHIERITLTKLNTRWVYRIQHAKARHDYWPANYSIFDAVSGKPVIINKKIAEQIALNSYRVVDINAPLEVTNIVKFDEFTPDLPKQSNPVWQVSINDTLNTKVMINALNGDVIAHINDVSKWRNLLLKLHFMDYANEGSFNNVFVQLLGFCALLLSLSGMYWVLELVKNRQFVLPARLLFIKKRSKLKITETIEYREGNIDNTKETSIRVSSNLSLLDAIQNANVDIKSACGGGGMCGQCICQVTSRTVRTTADIQHISKEMLRQKYRLSCQHRVSEVRRVILHR